MINMVGVGEKRKINFIKLIGFPSVELTIPMAGRERYLIYLASFTDLRAFIKIIVNYWPSGFLNIDLRRKFPGSTLAKFH